MNPCLVAYLWLVLEPGFSDMSGSHGTYDGARHITPMDMPVQDEPDIKKMDRSRSRSTPEPAHAEEGDRESKSQAIRQGEQEDELDEFRRGDMEERREARRFQEERERE